MKEEEEEEQLELPGLELVRSLRLRSLTKEGSQEIHHFHQEEQGSFRFLCFSCPAPPLTLQIL